MMVLFFHAARLALVDFDPFLSSRPLANVLLRSPQGGLITEGHYYPFSSIFFYTDRTALLLNGRTKNLEYGSYAPNARDVFIDDAQFRNLWLGPARYYLFAKQESLSHWEEAVGAGKLNIVAESGGKLLLTNQPEAVSILRETGFHRAAPEGASQ